MKNFKETQRFDQWWKIFFEIAIFLILVINYIKEYQKLLEDNNKESMMSLWIGGGSVLFVFVFINMIKLKIEINEKGISYQFHPLHLKPRFLFWEELSNCYVRKYAPISEYGGWGIRGLSRKKILGFNGNGKALNVKGNMGVQLEFKNGGKLLIGTQKPDKVKMIINNFSHKINVKTTVGKL